VSVAIAIICLSGCGKNVGTSVRGSVTWNGQPLEKGYITFYPVEGAEAILGAEINGGEFLIAKIPPGKRRVLVTALPKIQAHDRPQGVLLQVIPGQPWINADSVGNNRIVAIVAGPQVVDFALLAPPMR